MITDHYDEHAFEQLLAGLETGNVVARIEAAEALGRLGDLRRELDQDVNRVTAEALKRRAAQIGQIKEMTEDPQSGSLTIVVEV